MHILVVNDDGPPSPHSSPYVHSLVRELQAAGHTVSVVLPHVQRSWIGKAHQIGQTVKPSYYRPPPATSPPAGLPVPQVARSLADPHRSSDLESEDNLNAHGSTHGRPTTDPDVEEWVLVDGTPASCVQIGLYHFFKEKGPIDLVVSGPNYGRNTTAVFALSSGTLGAALEAAVCRRRAVALSYAFFTRNHDPVIVAAATEHSVRVIEALVKQWPQDGSVDLYSVNVPLVPDVDRHKTLWTDMLQNYWGEGSCFEEVEGSSGDEADEEERIREQGETMNGSTVSASAPKTARHPHKHFKWAPRFTDVYKSVDEAPPGNDGWAVKEGQTSVTPLKANFTLAKSTRLGQEFVLDVKGPTVMSGKPSLALTEQAGRSDSSQLCDQFYAVVEYDDSYVEPLIISALKSLFPFGTCTLLPSAGDRLPDVSDDGVCATSLASRLPDSKAKIVQIASYEAIDFDYAMSRPASCFINSYTIRKALIRKHFLTATVDHWVAKHPDSILASHVKRSESFEVDYAEFLDDALVEAFDLRASLDRNSDSGGTVEAICQDGSQCSHELGNSAHANRAGRPPTSQPKEWWILKPGMSDRGQGIRLFSTMEELQAIFDGWDASLSDADDDDDDDDNKDKDDAGGEEHEDVRREESAKSSAAFLGDEQRVPADHGEYITTSDLRHFVAQPYIDPPLLVPGDPRKFHIRTYVLAIGSLRVFVFREMLALFAAQSYSAPGDSANSNLDAHLTNTCLHSEDATKAVSVSNFWDLPLSSSLKTSVFHQICQVTGEVFEAAARSMTVHFQPLPNAFEVFGVDFLVDADGTAWLLEINAFPDFRQTGDKLRGIVAEFWLEALRLAIGPFVGLDAGIMRGGQDITGEEKAKQAMVLVRDVNLGQRFKAP